MKVLASVFALFMLVGCSFNGPTDVLLEAERSGRLQPGTTKPEVQAILGRGPGKWDMCETVGAPPKERFLWTPNGRLRSETGHFMLCFEGDVLVSHRRMFETDVRQAKFDLTGE